MNKIQQKALEYTSRGYSVMPVRKDKEPTGKWKYLQTEKVSDEQVEKWFKNGENIGIITGKISGLTVIDVDTYKGGDPTPFPETYTVKTGRGGLQLYYQYDPNFTISADGYPGMPGIDIRGEGGYVVAPPSVTDFIDKDGKKAGGPYTIEKNLPLAPFPAHLFPKTKPKRTLKETVGVKSGSRNDSIASVIGKLLLAHKESVWLSEVLPAVEKINATYSPPLSLDEVHATFNSIANIERNRKTLQTSNIDLLFTIKKTKDKETKVFTLNTENICRVLNQHESFAGTIRYDKFSNQIEIKENNIWREFGVGDEIVIQTKISILFQCFGNVNKQMVFDAIVKVARDNSIDSAIDYLKSITWDNTARLDHWLAHTYGVPDDEYHRSVASNWLKGLVKRLVVPGSKFDYVLVLEGEQGAKKSSSLGVLGGDWHVETAMSTDNKDFFMQFPGKAIIEFSEGETLSRTEVKRMKAIITMQKDRYRLPYARTTQDFPRRCVFAMTTNDNEYLKDETGNRRWLPVATIFPEANIDWLTENRDQLFAEAYHRVITLRETTYEFPKEETREAQDSRMVTDPNTDLVAEWYYTTLTDTDRANGITAHQVFSQCLHKNWGGAPMKKWEEMMIINILKKSLKLNKKRMMVNGAQANRWFGEEAIIPTATQIELTEQIF